MKDLVIIQKDQALTTSLKVAEVFKKRHDHVIRDIEEIIRQIAAKPAPDIETPKLGTLKNDALNIFQKSSYKVEGQNRSYPMYLMNRDGFSLLVMGFTGKKALQWKLSYIQAFNAMESKLIQLLAERKSLEYLEARASTKRGQRALTSVIKAKTIPNARANGSKCEERFFYSNVNNWINKTLGIESKMRDKLSVVQLHDVEVMQAIAAAVYDTEGDKGTSIHETNQRVKQAFEKYSEVAFLAQRYLLDK